MRLKAVFDNKDRALWPNQFVNVHLQLETRKNAIVVPASAVQRGPQEGTFAYVVGNDNTVQVRNLQVALTQGNIALIANGLTPGERVVTGGQEKLQPGMKVEAQAPQRSGAGQNNTAGGPLGAEEAAGTPRAGGGQGAAGAAPAATQPGQGGQGSRGARR